MGDWNVGVKEVMGIDEWLKMIGETKTMAFRMQETTLVCRKLAK